MINKYTYPSSSGIFLPRFAGDSSVPPWAFRDVSGFPELCEAAAKESLGTKHQKHHRYIIKKYSYPSSSGFFLARFAGDSSVPPWAEGLLKS